MRIYVKDLIIACLIGFTLGASACFCYMQSKESESIRDMSDKITSNYDNLNDIIKNGFEFECK